MSPTEQEVELLRAVATAAKNLVESTTEIGYVNHTAVDEVALVALESALEAAGYGMSDEEAAEKFCGALP